MAFPDNLRSLGGLRSRYRRTRRDSRTGGVAFVFQGGGNLSAPQVGMLRALSEAGVLPDLVVGSSARTLLAAALGRGGGLVSNSALRDLLRSAALPATLDGTSIPAHVMATDLGSVAAASPVDFRDTARLIDQGHQLTGRWLARQRADGPAPPDLPAVRVAGAS